MEDKKKNISNNKNINIENIDKEKKFTNKAIIPYIKNIKFIQRYSDIINLILVEIILILSSKRICYGQRYIEIKVNNLGYNQIISDEYRGTLPKQILVSFLNLI